MAFTGALGFVLLSTGKTKSKSDGGFAGFAGGSTSPSNGFVLSTIGGRGSRTRVGLGEVGEVCGGLASAVVEEEEEEEEKMSRMSLLGDRFFVVVAVDLSVGGVGSDFSGFSDSKKRGVGGFSGLSPFSDFSVFSGLLSGFSVFSGIEGRLVVEEEASEEKTGRGVMVGLKGMMKEGARLREGTLSSSCVILFGCGAL